MAHDHSCDQAVHACNYVLLFSALKHKSPTVVFALVAGGEKTKKEEIRIARHIEGGESGSKMPHLAIKESAVAMAPHSSANGARKGGDKTSAALQRDRAK